MTGETMTRKILVAYASRYGSTQEIAETMAEALTQEGCAVDCMNVMDVSDLSAYDAVVAGSPIHMGKWLVEAVDFVKRFRTPLNHLPLAVFAVGYSMKEETETVRKSARASMNEVRTYVLPLVEGIFAGRFDPEGMNGADLQIMKMAGAVPGDARDLDAVAAWARALPPLLFATEE